MSNIFLLFGTQLAKSATMKILIISQDNDFINGFSEVDQNGEISILVYKKNISPLDIVTYAFSVNPMLLIIDDDLLSPNSATIIKSFKKMKPESSIIFFTSSSSVELGRNISQLGIQYYGIKPFSKNEIYDLINSISISINKKLQITNKQKEELS